MKSTIKNLLQLIFLATLFSCSAEDEKARVELYQPDVFRQSLAYDPGNFRVEISINDSSPQVFSINADDPAPVVEISGVRWNQENNISVRWIEVVGGRSVRLSEQSQVFFADGGTIIDGPHVFSIFDDDGDQVSNFDERIAGTCVWVRNEICNTPPPESDVENLVINGDFSAEVTQWFSRGEGAYSRAGEYCVTHLAGTAYTNSFIVHQPSIALRGNLQYVISFDIKADLESNALVSINTSDETHTNVMQDEVTVSTNYERKNVWFPTYGPWPTNTLVFNFEDDRTVRYCIDNVSLVPAE